MPCRVPKRRFSCGAPQHLTKNPFLDIKNPRKQALKPVCGDFSPFSYGKGGIFYKRGKKGGMNPAMVCYALSLPRPSKLGFISVFATIHYIPFQ